MAKQETLTLFPDVEGVIKYLTDEQLGELMRAIIAYRFHGKSYSSDDQLLNMAFDVISNQVDRVEAARASKTDAAKKRWERIQEDADGMQSDAEPMQNYAEGMQSDAPIQSIPIQSIPIQSIPKESKAHDAPAPTKKSRKSYGEFGWVKLTDEEYHRLSNDLGEAEVKRCIAYVDESAQSTGNKNKWRDWNLVIRKCSREGWGLNRKGRPVDTNKGATGALGSAEIENIKRLMGDG